ncbi:beta-phosphoglucomutase family hydrolase [Prauserella cavernicola]|uniref:Beta-phosphoglucomutase n=1 Tax=Prauserella cavernicola TaxID=2800127 RepID=A0A934QUC8_9PSEU|nr:beta-phosphoglucomutase family hydrolase [Prauserella cavernicola]MBK1788407.1 beta-phosphoglucomutase family hydrolase [Prauserella cavernicola]
MIGLPSTITACLFDLDGVLTSTATLHMQAWKQTFDDLLRRRDGGDFQPFTERDYTAYVDGRPRLDGVRTFLASRDIELPEGGQDDSPDAVTVHGVGTRKNDLVGRILEEQGVQPYAGSVRYLEAVERAGLAIGVVTSSANAVSVLSAAGLDRFVRARVDGNTISERGLRGKPAPDSFLACAEQLGVAAAHAAVFEDALAGVEAGKAGEFGYVVGVNRADQAGALHERGASTVVDDLAELLEESP